MTLSLKIEFEMYFSAGTKSCVEIKGDAILFNIRPYFIYPRFNNSVFYYFLEFLSFCIFLRMLRGLLLELGVNASLFNSKGLSEIGIYKQVP